MFATSTPVISVVSTSGDQTPAPAPTEHLQNHSSSSTTTYMIYGGAGLGAVLIAAIVIIAIVKAKRAKKTAPKLKDLREIEDIQIGRVLGAGSFGQVYEGLWQGTTKVALKKVMDPEQFGAFVQEAAMLQYEGSSSRKNCWVTKRNCVDAISFCNPAVFP